MALFKKHKTEPVPPEDTGAHDTSVGTAADVEAVMKKYDRESNTRVWEGLPKLVIRWLMVAFSAYCIIDTVFLSTRQEVRLPMFVGLILLFGFLTFPAKKGDERVNHMPWYDIVLLIAGPGAYFFYAVNAQNVVQMSARVMQNDLYMIIGLIGILALVELLETEYGIVLGRRQAEMFISHLAETFRRMDHGETVAYMEEAAAGQLRAFGGSGTVDHMLRDFSRITGVRFPKSEEEYMKMYLSSLLSYNNH